MHRTEAYLPRFSNIPLKARLPGCIATDKAVKDVSVLGLLLQLSLMMSSVALFASSNLVQSLHDC